MSEKEFVMAETVCPRCGSADKGKYRYSPICENPQTRDPWHRQSKPECVGITGGCNGGEHESNCPLSAGRSLLVEAPTPDKWINEDELPADYPYDKMFPFSKLGPDGLGGVRIFPVVEAKPASKELSMTNKHDETRLREFCAFIKKWEPNENLSDELYAFKLAEAWLAHQSRIPNTSVLV